MTATEPTTSSPTATPAVDPRSIVVGTDGSDDADRAVRWAAEQAYAERRPLVVVMALGAPEIHGVTWSAIGTAYGVNPRDLLEAGEAVAKEAAEIAREVRPELDVTTLVRVADPRQVLVDLSHRAHLVVLGSRGRGAFSSKLLGSVGVAVSREAACPVVVCRPSTGVNQPRRGVLVGADGTPESLPVIEFAFQEAALLDLPLTVVHCLWDLEHGERPATPVAAGEPGLEEHRLLLAESVAGMCEKFPEVVVDRALARGLADAFLSQNGNDWDLVVVGRHPATSLRRLLAGAIATTVVEHAATTVAVVPQAAPGAEG